jgi:hypothetical protein
VREKEIERKRERERKRGRERERNICSLCYVLFYFSFPLSLFFISNSFHKKKKNIPHKYNK